MLLHQALGAFRSGYGLEQNPVRRGRILCGARVEGEMQQQAVQAEQPRRADQSMRASPSRLGRSSLWPIVTQAERGEIQLRP